MCQLLNMNMISCFIKKIIIKLTWLKLEEKNIKLYKL